MDEVAELKPQKPKILRWQGLLADGSRLLRVAIGVAIVLLAASLTFTQLGFVGVSFADGTTGYVVVLLALVSLGALLFGPLAGALIGFAAGVVLYIHAQILPLNHFELAFVTPLTSIAMFTVAGCLLGLFFAIALRNNPATVKRIVYIAIVCVVVSWIYTLSFGVSVFASLVVEIAENVGVDVSDSYVAQMAGTTAWRLGDLAIQAWLTALLMFAVCAFADWVARRAAAHQGAYGLRTVFGWSLAAAVTIAFMTLAAASYMVTTQDELNDADRAMKSEVEYLHQQIESTHDQQVSMLEFADKHMDVQNNLDALMELIDSLSGVDVLADYDKDEKGTAILAFGPVVDSSNDELYPKNEFCEDVMTSDMLEAMDKSIDTGQMQRFVFDRWAMGLDSQKQVDETPFEQPYIAYIYAEEFTTTNVEGNILHHTLMLVRSSDMVFASRETVMLWSTLSSLGLMLIVGLVVFLLLNHLVARRIDEENGALERITAGNLDVRAEAGGTREFESLSDGINTTVDAMKGWIAEAETRMDAELATARAIQESALPRTFPAFPDILRFDIYASMTAAKEVGGDFYDFFLIGDDAGPDAGKLGFVVADVSGKGVPAALFMMEAKTQIRSYVASGMELGEAIENANRQLCDGNDAGMFVTAWVGVLDYATGHVDYVNAGHNPPLLWAVGGDAQSAGWRWLTQRSGLPLGLFDGLPYTAHSVDCLPGDQFLLYSDGVTEAMSTTEELYGEDRLMAVAEANYLRHPRELLKAVRADVALHAQGAEQSDDITILSLEVGVPPEETVTLTVPADVAQLSTVNDFIHTELDRRLCPKRVQNLLDVAVEELFVNVCRYAYPDSPEGEPGSVRVSCTYSAEPQSMTIMLTDSGVPFDPLAKPDAVTPEDIFDVPIGGLGILMAKRSVDEMGYERSGNFNVVSIMKKW